MCEKNCGKGIELPTMPFNPVYGMQRAIDAQNAGKLPKVFDWHKAARLIAERKPSIVYAGLAEDWEYTLGVIFRNGSIVTSDLSTMHLFSVWATPVIEIDGEVLECYIEHTKENNPEEWDADTVWPDSAKNVLCGRSSSGNPEGWDHV